MPFIRIYCLVDDEYLTNSHAYRAKSEENKGICDPLGTHAYPYVIENLRGCGRDALA